MQRNAEPLNPMTTLENYRSIFNCLNAPWVSRRSWCWRARRRSATRSSSVPRHTLRVPPPSHGRVWQNPKPAVGAQEVVALAGAEAQRNAEPDPEKRKYPGGAFDPVGLSKDGKARQAPEPFPMTLFEPLQGRQGAPCQVLSRADGHGQLHMRGLLSKSDIHQPFP